MEALQIADEPDTLVVDPETDEMQIHGDDGLWHRLVAIPGHDDHLACGQAVDFRLRQGTRRDSYDGPLCPLCYSPFEVGVSAGVAREVDRKRRDREHALGSQPIPTITIPPKEKK